MSKIFYEFLIGFGSLGTIADATGGYDVIGSISAATGCWDFVFLHKRKIIASAIITAMIVFFQNTAPIIKCQSSRKIANSIPVTSHKDVLRGSILFIRSPCALIGNKFLFIFSVIFGAIFLLPFYSSLSFLSFTVIIPVSFRIFLTILSLLLCMVFLIFWSTIIDLHIARSAHAFPIMFGGSSAFGTFKSAFQGSFFEIFNMTIPTTIFPPSTQFLAAIDAINHDNVLYNKVIEYES